MKLKGGFITKDPRLDRVPQFDPKSRAFPIRQLVGEKPLRSYTWSLSRYLDQGREGACVGFSLSHELIARPAVVLGIDDGFARNIYREAQKIDEWPGENYEGTSVLAGIKTLQAKGFYKEYRWAFGLRDAQLAIGYAGPGVAGLNWYEGMLRPDAKGFIHPTGSIVGGHAIIVRGISLKGEYVLLSNSWGQSWGMNGDCKLSFADFDRLLHEQGEFVIPVGRTR